MVIVVVVAVVRRRGGRRRGYCCDGHSVMSGLKRVNGVLGFVFVCAECNFYLFINIFSFLLIFLPQSNG